MVARTLSGEVTTCDGCGAAVEEVTAAMTRPVPRELALGLYGRPSLTYIVCAPLADGTQPCLDLAQLADEMFDQTRCRKPGCTGVLTNDCLASRHRYLSGFVAGPRGRSGTCPGGPAAGKRLPSPGGPVAAGRGKRQAPGPA